MSGKAPIVRLRAAEAADYDFARRVHHAGMRWIGERLLGCWDEAAQDARFQGKFVLAEVRVIVAGGDDGGYLQVAAGAGALELKELHIAAPFQKRGIGSEVLRLVLADARRLAKPATVSVVKFNPALAFYQRAGFRIVGQDDQRFFMQFEGGQ
jgi:ribosomal protein S18 acetylase RimI-like enzyme